MWYVQPAKPQTSQHIYAVESEPFGVTKLNLKEGYTGSSESIHNKIPYFGKSHVKAKIRVKRPTLSSSARELQRWNLRHMQRSSSEDKD